MATTPSKEIERTHFCDSLSNSLAVPLAAVRAVGPAAETLATVMQISLGETFVSQNAIAERARLPVDTVKKHLNKLVPEWIENNGRQRTKGGRVRRTVTLHPTAMARHNRSPYLLIPWWASCWLNLKQIDRTRKTNRLSWSEKVLLGIVVSRFVGIQTGTDDANPGCINTDAYEPERYEFSLRYLEKQTGLDHKTITRAKQSLHRVKLISWRGEVEPDGKTTDFLVPNFLIDVVEKPAVRSGFVHVSLVFRNSLLG